MSIKSITGTVTNSAGKSVEFGGQVNIKDDPVVTDVLVTPDPAPSGTMRIITVTATDPRNSILTFTCQVDGLEAKPVDGRPNQFTITI